jgi:hypothetical protein
MVMTWNVALVGQRERTGKDRKGDTLNEKKEKCVTDYRGGI